MFFKITRPGKYTVPGWGRLDASSEINTSPEKLLSLFEHKGFPWISLVLEDATFKWLKKQKLGDKRIVKMIQKSKDPKEIEFLLKLTKSKPVHNIGENKITLLAS